MKIFLTLLIYLLSLSIWAQEDRLVPFTTDYCTNFPEGTHRDPELWKDCCLKHDLYFWAGGSYENRETADLGLKECIEATGEKEIARLMYWAVKVGSYSPIKYSSKKWNNGWPHRTDYQALTQEDIDQIEKEIDGGYDFISLDIKHQFIYQLRSRLD